MSDIAKLKTKQHTYPRLDKSKYQKRAGLEGPFMTKSGQVVYYDNKKGKYLNPDNDMYLSICSATGRLAFILLRNK